MTRHVVETYRDLPPGNDGIAVTARRLGELIRTQSGTLAPMLQGWPDRDTESLVERILYWTRGHMVYTRDPPNVDRIQSPDLLYAEIQSGLTAVGDCDDYVSLAGGLLWQAGLAFRLVMVGVRPGTPVAHLLWPNLVLLAPGEPDLTHVYLRVRLANGWAAMDPTMDGWPLGLEVDPVTIRVETVP